MATMLKHACKISSFNYKLESHLNHVFRSCSKRYLFSSEILGIEPYLRNRDQTLHRMGDLKSKFSDRISEYLKTDDANTTIFTDDLKTMIYTLNSDEIDLAEKMIVKYHQQSSNIRFSTFNFGPLVLRMCHVLKLPDFAYKFFMDPNLDGFFDHMSSFVIIMDILFENEEYAKTLLVMQKIVEKNLNGIKYPIDCLTLACAAALKQNTPQSLSLVRNLIKDATKSGNIIALRTLIYASYLAYKQNNFDVAIELLNLHNSNKFKSNLSTSFINMKILINIALKRYDECIANLKSITNEDIPDQYHRQSFIFQSILDQLRNAIESSNDQELVLKFNSIKTILTQSSQLKDADFDEYLFRPIIRRRRLHDGYKDRERSQIPQDNRNFKPFRRPGLLDA